MTCDEVQDMVDDLHFLVMGLDDFLNDLRVTEEDAGLCECDRVAKAMHALRGAVLGFKDDVLGIIDG